MSKAYFWKLPISNKLTANVHPKHKTLVTLTSSYFWYVTTALLILRVLEIQSIGSRPLNLQLLISTRCRTHGNNIYQTICLYNNYILHPSRFNPKWCLADCSSEEREAYSWPQDLRLKSLDQLGKIEKKENFPLLLKPYCPPGSPDKIEQNITMLMSWQWCTSKCSNCLMKKNPHRSGLLRPKSFL